jgi:hypothetical protein
MPNELVLMVEGDSETASVPGMTHRLLRKLALDSELVYYNRLLRVGGLSALVRRDKATNTETLVSEAEGNKKWHRYLGVARKEVKQGNNACILLLLDGERSADGSFPFCAMKTAKFLAKEAADAGAGNIFSLAIVFVRQEFESWLLAGCLDLAKNLTTEELKKLEEAPRDAKKRIHEITGHSYKETTHQPAYAAKLDFALLETRMRSFLRFENALRQLGATANAGNFICTP